MATKTRKPAAPATPEQQLLAIARKARETALTWGDLSNAVMGIGGPLSQLFPTREARQRLMQTPEYKEVMDMIEEMMREEDEAPAGGRVLVRLPKAVHSALLAEAKAEGVSLNQLCLAKLCVQLRAAVEPKRRTG